MSPIHLHLQTLSLVLILVTAFLSFVMVFVWAAQKTYNGFGFWVVSNLAVGFGILLLGFDGAPADVAGTSVTFAAVLIGYEGNRRFLGLKHNLFFSSFVFILQFAALIYFKFFDGDNVISQVAFTSSLVGAISAVCGYIFLCQARERADSSYCFTGITYYIFALIMLVRTIVTVYMGDKTDFFNPEGIQPVFFILYILFEIVWTFNYINLNSKRLQSELIQAQAELEQLATTDFLTGINNKRNFMKIGENEILRANRFRYPLSLIMFDIDFFKSVNDKHGHAAGDCVLMEIAEICRGVLRLTDSTGRLGGEEFAILLTNTDINGATTVAEYLRACIEETQIKHDSKIINVTASFGVAELRDSDEKMAAFLDRADIALYEAKHCGRNRVVAVNDKQNYQIPHLPVPEKSNASAFEIYLNN